MPPRIFPSQTATSRPVVSNNPINNRQQQIAATLTCLLLGGGRMPVSGHFISGGIIFFLFGVIL